VYPGRDFGPFRIEIAIQRRPEYVGRFLIVVLRKLCIIIRCLAISQRNRGSSSTRISSSARAERTKDWQTRQRVDAPHFLDQTGHLPVLASLGRRQQTSGGEIIAFASALDAVSARHDSIEIAEHLADEAAQSCVAVNNHSSQ
jgi:hypothetical protein